MVGEVSLYVKVIQQRKELYNAALDDGIYTPFIVPLDLIPVIVCALAIAYSPRDNKNGLFVRWAAGLVSLAHMLWRWPHVRTIGLASGYGIGLSGFWGLVMIINLLLIHDPATDFERIEISSEDVDISCQNEVNGHPGSTALECNGNTEYLVNGKAGSSAFRKSASTTATSPDVSSDTRSVLHLSWQTRPPGGWHLLDWTMDLMTSFRLINWNVRIPIKTYIAQPPAGKPLQFSKEAKVSNINAMQRLRRSAITSFMSYYLILDILKTALITDPYWLGIAPLESSSAWPWLNQLDLMIPGATKFARLGISLIAVVSALTIIFSLNPLFFGTILPTLFGDSLPHWTRCPLEEPWMYPPQWGSMFKTLREKGLAGMWSTWWHQMFRFGISEPSRLLIAKLHLDRRGHPARFIQLAIAFGLTAGIHAFASSTTFSIVPAKPQHSFLFFISQAVGILIQTETSKMLNKRFKFSTAIRQSGNMLFVIVFLFYTGPWLADDFSRCGIWLFEPLPFSIFRGLGFGPGDVWAPWFQGSEVWNWLGLWKGTSWYESGLAIF